ncbi:MAG: hypothetical protein JW913_07090 [Chitinispirillaceae bacterium]|nr:hypothetical protein [Chitinispirillaceae bacterium]
MRIVASEVSLASSRISIATSTVQEHLRKWDSNSDVTYDSEKTNGRIITESMLKKDVVQISQPTPRILPQIIPDSPPEQQKTLLKGIDDEFIGDIKAQIMKEIIEMFTGREIKVFNPDDMGNQDCVDTPPGSAQETTPADQASQMEGWGIDYHYKETHYTEEGVAFSASGAVKTADGRSIRFDVGLELSRETYGELNISLKASDALKDPLIIDLNGIGAAFSDMKFEFDIDADGAGELLYAPREGTAFLAYDKNGNGIVDDGSELFGPQSGNGFSELARLDEDGNGWIDEGDSAFSRLKVWEKAADGTDYVSSLLQSGIGALYTGSAKTQYDITTPGNELAAVLRESGVYLKENGGTGVVQEVDVAV